MAVTFPIVRRPVDWFLCIPAVILSLLGIITLYGGTGSFFTGQVVWVALGVTVCLIFSQLDFHFLRRRNTVLLLYAITALLLLAVLFVGVSVKGAQSRFSLGAFAVQPSELAKLAIAIVLAKYFTRRHVDIAHFRHIVVSGIYAAVFFLLIMLQPDFGSAIMILAVWAGIVFVSGISKKHIVIVALLAVMSGVFLWTSVLAPYQKERIVTFLNPTQDLYGSGYNVYQSMIAVGSGELLGKGIGYGTQSKLRFLPEYQTDFIFASFAEEWGFVGVILLLLLFSVLLGRILMIAAQGESNFEKLFAVGIAVLFATHVIIHIGMNMGLLPVTGITLPFLSYGGSHMLVEFAALGILSSMQAMRRPVPFRAAAHEFVGSPSKL